MARQPPVTTILWDLLLPPFCKTKQQGGELTHSHVVGTQVEEVPDVFYDVGGLPVRPIRDQVHHHRPRIEVRNLADKSIKCTVLVSSFSHHLQGFRESRSRYYKPAADFCHGFPVAKLPERRLYELLQKLLVVSTSTLLKALVRSARFDVCIWQKCYLLNFTRVPPPPMSISTSPTGLCRLMQGGGGENMVWDD